MPTPESDRRSAPAANADVLGEEARNDGSLDELAPQVGRDGTPRDRGQARSEPGEGEARPGKDENQAGFLKDTGDKPGSP